MNSQMFRWPALAALLIACSLIAPSQDLNLESLRGRWSLVSETDQRQSEMIADLHIDPNGKAKLVILSAAHGDDGIFTGKLTGQQLLLNGQYEGSEAKLELTFTHDRASGKMMGDQWSTNISGQRVQVIASEIPVSRYEMLFDAVWNGVSKYFYDPKLNGVNLAAVRQRHLPHVKAARSDSELVIAIRQSLRELHSADTDFLLSTGRPMTKLKTDRVTWKSLSPGMIYLSISNFIGDDLRQFDAMLDRAMDEVSKHQALVLDLRGNRGENLEAAMAALNFLLPEGRSIAYFATRDGLARLGVSSIDQIDPPSLPAAFIDNQIGISKFQGAGMYLAGGKYKRPYLGRMVVLVDESCAGSCELFAAAMKESGAATLIGRRTRGALLSSSPVTFTSVKWIPMFKSDIKGWRMDLPMMDLRTAGRMKIEGKGVDPDVVVERSSTDDAELKRAVQWLAETKRH